MALPCPCCDPGSACRAVAPALPAFFGEFTAANGRVPGPGPNEFTFPNFLGSGVSISVRAIGDPLVPGSQGAQVDVLAVGTSPPQFVDAVVTFSQPVYLRRFGITDLDFPGADEQAFNFSPLLSGVYGQKVFQTCNPSNGGTAAANPYGCVKDSVVNGTGGVTFASPLTGSLTFRVSRVAGGAGHFWTELGFDLTPRPTRSFVPAGTLRPGS